MRSSSREKKEPERSVSEHRRGHGFECNGKPTAHDEQHGAAPRAFLVVTLAASLVQDLINAAAVQGMLSWVAGR